MKPDIFMSAGRHDPLAGVAIILLILSLAVLTFSLLTSTLPPAYAHFFGGRTLDFDRGYQVTFVPAPSVPVGGNNSTVMLNFSVLQDNSNINNVYSALVITDKKTGMPVKQFPYKLYVFSDISIPFVFEKEGEYVVTLQTSITGDAKYQASPLAASFDLSVANPYQAAFSDRNTIVILLVAVIIGCAAVAIYGWRRM